MIHIVDYGVGNIQAFLTLFKRLGIDACRSNTADSLLGATKLVLPGVGHFDHAIQSLNKSGLRANLERMVMEDMVPVLGVCVGMQILADGSDEGVFPGLGWIPGRVRAFEICPESSRLPMPHMGWNTLQPRNGAKLFSGGLDDNPEFYFLHSFFFDAKDKTNVTSTARYGIDFDASVSLGHIHGIQCHPEKSHRWGAKFMKNFSEL